MKPISKRTSNSRGFTLIEVMASLAILGVTIISIMTIRANNSRAIAESVKKRTVSMLLRRKLTQVLTDRNSFSGIVEDSGNLSDYGYESIRWRASISPEAIPSLDPDEDAASGTLYRVSLTLEYQFQERPRTITVVTYRSGSTLGAVEE